LRKSLNVTADRITLEPPDLVFWRKGKGVYRCAIADLAAIGLPEGSNGPVRGSLEYLAEVHASHERAYHPWSPSEELRLRELFEREASVDEMTAELGRQPGAITSRLRKLGLIEVPAAGSSMGDGSASTT
jgi:hypothetical protein